MILMKNLRFTGQRARRATDADDANLVSSLHRLGFTDHEARAYLALVAASPATAYEVAKTSALPRPNVYNVLRTLQEKGAIQPVSENPLRYVPIDPKQFFGHLERTSSELCRDVVAQVQRTMPSTDDAYVWLATGRDEVMAKIRDLILNAKAEIWIKTAAHLLQPLTTDIREAADRGVEVKVVLYGAWPEDLSPHPRVKLFAHEGEGTTQGISDILFTMTVDLDGVIIATFASKTTASYARNHSVIYVTQVYLLHEMYLADIYGELGAELDRRFGKGLARLRDRYRPYNMERYVVEGAT